MKWSTRLKLAWAALRGRLTAGIYITPLDPTKARFEVESCRVERCIGRDTPLLQFDRSWQDVTPAETQPSINRSAFYGAVR